MTEFRIAHLADTHLGYRALFRADPETGRNQRAVDVELAFERVVDDLLTREVDLVLHAGDVFHQTRPSWAAIRCFVRQVRRISDAGIPMLVIGGNHDTARLRSSGSVFSVLELALSDVRFVCGYEQEQVDFDRFDLTVTAVPHGKLADPISPSAFPVKNRRNILITHGLTSDVHLKGGHREPGEEEISDHLLDEEFEYIALGHYHVFHRPKSNAWYAGSSERFGFGDEDVTPGYAILQVPAAGRVNDVEHVSIECRPMKTLTPVSGDGRNARDIADIVLEQVRRFADPSSMVRVELRDATRPLRREAEALLRRESGEYCWSLSVFTRGDLLATPGERAAGSGSTDVRTLFDEFVTERNYESAFAAAFRERGLRALDEAIRAAEPIVAEDAG